MSAELKYEQYSEILRQIIIEIKTTRVVVAHRVNSAMMQMYWNKGYGSGVVKQLLFYLQQEFPDTTFRRVTCGI
jgi:hypothetical protein